MEPSGREDQVLALITKHHRQLNRLAESRCPRDGRLLGAAYRLPDGMWIWSAGRRESAQAARIAAAALYLDEVEDCQTVREVNACLDAASKVLSSDHRPRARPAVVRIDSDTSGPSSYRIGRPFAMSMFVGGGFAVTEVSCGCRRGYYLDIRALIERGLAAMRGEERATVRVKPLPPDLPQREASRLLASMQPARA